MSLAAGQAAEASVRTPEITHSTSRGKSLSILAISAAASAEWLGSRNVRTSTIEWLIVKCARPRQNSVANWRWMPARTVALRSART